MEEEKLKTTRRERFVKIAEQRTNKIINMLRLLGNCANRSNYEYSDDDVKKIFAAIDEEMRVTKNKFKGAAVSDKSFRLS